MGLTIILFIIFAVLAVLFIAISQISYINVYYDRLSSALHFIGTTLSFMTVYLFVFVLFLLGCFCARNYNKTNAEIERTRIERLITEDYNVKNLQKALAFNIDQKESALCNKSFYLYGYNHFYVVDTIPIPEYKFTPKKELKVNINHDEVK